ncbi:hypothetical protein DESC_370239 [Desulfosarcina cetonica]|nr:hypothetical protein DESC_370239 [Desulfosarcina cetonica]
MVQELSLKTQHQGTGHPAQRGDQHEGFEGDRSDSQKETEVVLGKPGKDEEDQKNDDALPLEEMVEARQLVRRNPAPHEAFAKIAADDEIDPGSHGQRQAGVEKSAYRAEEISADESGGLARNGGEDHLNHLQGHERQGRAAAEGTDHAGDLIAIGKPVIGRHQPGGDFMAKA